MKKKEMTHAEFVRKVNRGRKMPDAQVPELQVGWPVLWAKRAESLGYDPTGTIFEIDGGKIRIVKAEDGYNWECV